jgi:hypothetical protein
MDTSRVTTGDKVTAAAALLLLIDLCFLPWHQVYSFSSTAIEGTGGWWGTLAALLTLVILVELFLRRLAAVDLSWAPLPIGRAHLAATAVVLALLVAKLARDPDLLGFGAWLGVLLAATMVAGAVLGRDETDEPPPVGSGGREPTPF